MIQGINLSLKPPEIKWEGYKFINNNEIKEMLKAIEDYFKQTSTIYDASLILTNNNYKILQGKYGIYKKRIDYEFKLRYLKKIILDNDYIRFILFNNENEDDINIRISKNFFYFIEWEDEYYI